MTRPLPKWIMQGYAELWKRFGTKEFEHQEAEHLQNTSVLLSILKKNGWLDVSLHPEDSRKRIYKLKDPETAIKEMER